MKRRVKGKGSPVHHPKLLPKWMNQDLSAVASPSAVDLARLEVAFPEMTVASLSTSVGNTSPRGSPIAVPRLSQRPESIHRHLSAPSGLLEVLSHKHRNSLTVEVGLASTPASIPTAKTEPAMPTNLLGSPGTPQHSIAEEGGNSGEETKDSRDDDNNGAGSNDGSGDMAEGFMFGDMEDMERERADSLLKSYEVVPPEMAHSPSIEDLSMDKSSDISPEELIEKEASYKVNTCYTLLAYSNPVASKVFLDFFRGLSGPMLDCTTLKLDVRYVLKAMETSSHKLAFVAFLTRERIQDISTVTRAHLIRAFLRLAREDSSGPAIFREGINQLLVNTKGHQLTNLKVTVDTFGKNYDMVKVFELFKSGAEAKTIREHLKREASKVKIGIKVLSDIDDTLFANYKDGDYARGVPYPGIRMFFKELLLVTRASAPNTKAADLAGISFVTARPRTLMQDWTHKQLEKLGIGPFHVMFGAATHLFPSGRIAEMKFRNFEKYYSVYQEYHFVILGDSGQGDVAWGERCLREYPESVLGVFIHDVINVPEEKREAYRQRRIFLFDTYAGAAYYAYLEGILEKEVMTRIAMNCQAEFQTTRFKSPSAKEKQFRLLSQDLSMINKKIGSSIGIHRKSAVYITSDGGAIVEAPTQKEMMQTYDRSNSMGAAATELQPLEYDNVGGPDGASPGSIEPLAIPQVPPLEPVVTAAASSFVASRIGRSNSAVSEDASE